jgi:DNA-binding beta-propeller fold protein YncE
VDSSNGRVLVADTGNQRIKSAAIDDLAGTPSWAEAGYLADRTAAGALDEPQGIAGDASGVYVANTFRGEVERFRWDASSHAYAADPAFAAATGRAAAGKALRLPRDVAVAGGKVYLLDSGNHRVLIADAAQPAPWTVVADDPGWDDPYGLDVAAGGVRTTFGAYGTQPGFFRGPRDVAVAPDGCSAAFRIAQPIEPNLLLHTGNVWQGSSR